jgi:hypothetical protein
MSPCSPGWTACLRLIEDMSYEEIGDVLDIPMGTVKSRIARARQHLNRSLGITDSDSVHAHAQELARGRYACGV